QLPEPHQPPTPTASRTAEPLSPTDPCRHRIPQRQTPEHHRPPLDSTPASRTRTSNPLCPTDPAGSCTGNSLSPTNPAPANPSPTNPHPIPHWQTLSPTGSRTSNKHLTRNCVICQPQPHFQNQPANPLHYRNPNVMDLLAMNSCLSDYECQKIIQAGKCFQCRQVGHMSRDCPKKKNPSQSSRPIRLTDLQISWS
ncbi:hypothetical protein VP01_7734g1, partial [Puccinia sorghi]